MHETPIIIQSTPQPASVLDVVITDAQALYQAFMPFIRDGGLFIATHQTFQLGDKVILQLRLMAEPTPYSVSAQVIWLTPGGAQGGRMPGIGVQFDANTSATLLPRLLAYIPDALTSTQATQTL